jgi:voltage-gated potassium channel
VPAIVLVFVQFARIFWRGVRKDREFRAVGITTILLLATGTVFYCLHEGWSVVDAFYFSVILLTTVGLGDLSPTTTVSKLFTCVYLMLGLGVIVAFANELLKQAKLVREERLSRKG